MILLALALIAQSSGDRLPPANPVPYTDPDAANVMAPVNRMLAAIAARDAAAISAELHPDGGATVAVERPDGSRAIRHLSWAQFTAGVKPGPERFEERMTDVAIEVDGDVAMVWGPYVFTINGKPDHCGVNHFDLVRDAGRWKVQNVTWSQRSTGCEVR